MSTGTPSDPVCDNQTTALIARPLGVAGQAVPLDPTCRAFPTAGDQTATPGAPPSR